MEPILFRKKTSNSKFLQTETTVLDQKVDAIIRYAHIYSSAYYNILASQFDSFKQATNDYSFGFMELYTIAALGVSFHSPSISETNFFVHLLSASERQLKEYFNGSKNDLYLNLLNFLEFEKKYTNHLIKDGYNFSDIPAYWLLYTLNVYKEFVENYDLISTLGNELTNHYIHIFEGTWEPRKINPSELLNQMINK